MSVLSISTRALMNYQSMLDVTSHNISNANTPGYSRQTVSIQSVEGQQRGGMFFGNGAQIEDVRRSEDVFLNRASNTATTLNSFETTRFEGLQSIETMFPVGPTSIGSVLNDALNAWDAVQSNPSNQAAKQVLIQKNMVFADRIRSTYDALDSNVIGLKQQRASIVEAINQSASQIATLNENISRNWSRGAPNDLLDQRDAVIAKLNSYINVSTVEQKDGQVLVFAGGSFNLVNNSSTTEFKDTSVLTDQLTGGSFKGVQTLLQDDIPSVYASLNSMVKNVGETLNRQHQLGLDASGTQGQPWFSDPAEPSTFRALILSPQKVASSSSVALVPLSSNSTNLLIAGAQQISTIPGVLPITITFNAGGQWTSDGGATFNTYTPGKPLSVPGYTFTLEGMPTNGDSFTLQAITPGNVSANGENAKAILDLLDEVGPTGDIVSESGTTIMTNLSGRINQSKMHQLFAQQLADNAQSRLHNATGVNLDEEASKLIQYQQSYAAAAQAIKTSQTLFNVLISTING